MKKIIITTFLCAVAMVLGAQMSTVMSQMQQQGRALTSSAVWGEIIGLLSDQDDLQAALDAKQATLVSATNIKTINSTTLLGSGNIAIVGVSDGDKTGVQVSSSGTVWTLKKFGTIYDVTQYGLVGDNSTDNSSAMATLVAAVAAHSTLYFPVGTYRFTTGITINKTVHIKGDGDLSRLETSANITLLNYDAGGSTTIQGLILEDFGINNNNGGTPNSSSIGIRIDLGFQLKVEHVFVWGFYKNIQLVSPIDDVWHNITCGGMVNIGMERISNSPYVDSGDGAISDSRFLPYGRNCTYSIFHQNGGGLKITNTKFNYDSSGPYKASYHYYYDAAGTTVDINIANCSFENYSDGAIRIGETSGNIREVAITGNDIGATSTSGVEGITLIGVDIVTITGNTFKGGSGSSTAISITNGDNITECGNTFDSWTNNVTNSGATNFRQCQY